MAMSPTEGGIMYHEYERIFAALDGGSTMHEVARKAVRAASNNGASLLFGHVLDSVPDALTPSDYRRLANRAVQRIEEELADILGPAREDPDIPSVEIKVAWGRINETLLNDLIKPYDPDLVYCGERGLSNITYVFVGSTSTYLIRNLTCDVHVVKQR
jgi:nucleotide-binding universal stress UspA family protein